MISVGYVGFASHDVVCDELHDYAWKFVCSSFLISMCVHVYCVESFAHIECYSDCSRRGGGHLLELLRYYLMCVVVVNVECCVRMLRGCAWYVYIYTYIYIIRL